MVLRRLQRNTRRALAVVRRFSRPACVCDPHTREKLCTSGTPAVGGKKKVCNTSAEAPETTRETCRRRPATAQGSPATRRTTWATSRGPSPTASAREEAFQLRRGNGQQGPGNVPTAICAPARPSRNVPTTPGNQPTTPGNQPTDARQHRRRVGNVASAVSHTRSSVERRPGTPG